MTEKTAVQRFQERVVEMLEQGNTGWHISTGPKWHGLTIEEKCKYILEVWDAPRRPLDFKDSYRAGAGNYSDQDDPRTNPNPI